MDNILRERLNTIAQRCEYLQKMMELPSVASDFNRSKLYAKELSSLSDVNNMYKEFLALEKNLEEALILSKDKDPEIAESMKQEVDSSYKRIETLTKEIEMELIPKDPNDGKNVIMEIRGAAGGDEGNIFAGDLFRMYTRYCEERGWKIEVLDLNESSAGGYSFVSFMVRGKKVYSELKYESGAHRVQRVPSTEGSGRVHTSTATVLVMPEADEVDVKINISDIKIDTYRASGAGGQHVNKTDSAVRLTHLPTGVVVACQEGRSQHENKDKAMAMLRTKIYDKIQQENDARIGAERKSKVGTGDRSEKIRTYNYPQNRVTDHRISLTIQQLDRIVDGDLEDIIGALINEDQRQKIKGGSL
jgi:peptide chain release factor 1